MKKTILVGNRLNALEGIGNFPDLQLIKIYALKDSLLHKQLPKNIKDSGIEIDVFSMQDKTRILEELGGSDFDILLSNGCPFILPVSKLKKDYQLYINVHPTLLPDLQGKTPLNGVFMTHRKKIGATMHYIDDGIDTGRIVAQESIALTPDLDQGLVYRLSFDAEKTVFNTGMQLLVDSDYTYEGRKQTGEGSYFNRTPEMQQIDTGLNSTDEILDKIKSFGVKTQGSFLTIGSKKYIVYSGDKIINEYLLEKYLKIQVGEIAMEYDGKFIIKTRDGLIKITDYELDTATLEKA